MTEVYVMLEDGRKKSLCTCATYNTAHIIAYLLADSDSNGNAYYISVVPDPDSDFVLCPGGGSYEKFQKRQGR